MAYASAQLFDEHARVVSHFERVAGFEPREEPAFRVEGSLAPLVMGCFGAAYTPRSGLVARAWSAITRSAEQHDGSDDATRLNALTLRAAFVLMASTGIRRQEVAPLRRSRLDLAAQILRVKGKDSSYFREAREVPLPELAVAELRAYVEATSGFDVVGATDALVAQVPFSIQTMRNALRTELHERDAPSKR